MEWTDCLDIQSCGSFQELLNLCTVFSNDSDIVTACFAVPVFLHVKCSEFTESISGKQNFVSAVICNHNFWPVNHRCEYKCQNMFSKCQALAVTYYEFLSVQVHVSEEILHHGKSLCVGNNCCVRICFHEVLNISSVVRFHMLYNQIIRLRSVKNLCYICKPFILEISIYSIHNCDLFIHDHI